MNNMTGTSTTTSDIVDTVQRQISYDQSSGLPIFMGARWQSSYHLAVHHAQQLRVQHSRIEGDGLRISGKSVTFYFSAGDPREEAAYDLASQIKRMLLATPANPYEAQVIVGDLKTSMLRQKLYIEENPSQSNQIRHEADNATAQFTALVANTDAAVAPWLVMMAVYHKKQEELHIVMSLGEGALPRYQDRQKMLDIEAELMRYSRNIQQGEDSTLQERYVKV